MPQISLRARLRQADGVHASLLSSQRLADQAVVAFGQLADGFPDERAVLPFFASEAMQRYSFITAWNRSRVVMAGFPGSAVVVLKDALNTRVHGHARRTARKRNYVVK
jgi:hypothetical protein